MAGKKKGIVLILAVLILAIAMPSASFACCCDDEPKHPCADRVLQNCGHCYMVSPAVLTSFNLPSIYISGSGVVISATQLFSAYVKVPLPPPRPSLSV